jgi:hypothetical protein
MYPALDKAELDCRQGNHDRHQDYRLRGRPAEIESDNTVIPDLVDEDLGSPRRTALGDVLNDPEGVEKSLHDIDNKQKKAGRCQ